MRISIFHFFIFLSFVANAQTGNWVLTTEQGYSNEFSAIVGSTDGGYFAAGVVAEGKGLIGDSTYSSSHLENLFISKINSQGIMEWFEVLQNGDFYSPTGNMKVRDLIIDHINNCLYVGLFVKGTSGDLNYSSSPRGSYVVVNFDFEGNLNWTKSFLTHFSQQQHRYNPRTFMELNKENLLEVGIFATPKDTLLVLEDEVKLDPNRTYYFTLDNLGEIKSIEAGEENAFLMKKNTDNGEVFFGNCSGVLSISGQIINPNGEAKHSLVYSMVGNEIKFLEDFGENVTISSAQILENGGVLLIGSFFESINWNGRTFSSLVPDELARFLFYIDNQGDLVWSRIFVEQNDEAFLGWVNAEVIGNEILVSALLSGYIKIMEGPEGEVLEVPLMGSSTWIQTIDMESGNSIGAPLLFNNIVSGYKGPFARKINDKLLFAARGHYKCTVGGLDMEFTSEFGDPFPGGFIMEFDELSSMQEFMSSGGGRAHIYENPTKGYSNIDLPSHFFSEPLNLMILNSSSKVILQKDLPQGTTSLPLDLMSYPKGEYVIIVSTPTESVSGKLVLE